MLQGSLYLFRAQGNEKDASLALIHLGFVKANLGDHESARASFEASLAIRRKLKDKRLIAMALMNLGTAVNNLADHALARAHYEEALSLLRQAKDRRSIAACLGNLAYLEMTLEVYPLAWSLYEESLTILRDIGDKYLMRFTHYNIANLAIRMGNVEKACSAYAACLQLSWEAQIFGHVIGSLAGVSNVLVQQEQWERGIQIWGAAEALHMRHSIDLDPEKRQRHAQLLPTVIAAIGMEVYEQALNAGHCLSPEAAIALALGVRQD